MERERYDDDDLVERESESRPDATAVYGETDTDPAGEDQRYAHHAGDDEHV